VYLNATGPSAPDAGVWLFTSPTAAFGLYPATQPAYWSRWTQNGVDGATGPTGPTGPSAPVQTTSNLLIYTIMNMEF
jgi:hypothetical protein